jgi:hypothetical protein
MRSSSRAKCKAVSEADTRWERLTLLNVVMRDDSSHEGS